MDNARVERTVVVRKASWTMQRTVFRIATSMRESRLDAEVTATSPRYGEVELGSAKKFSPFSLMILNARLGDEILLKASGPDAIEVLDAFEAAVDDATEWAREEIERAIERARSEGDSRREKRYASEIEPRDT